MVESAVIGLLQQIGGDSSQANVNSIVDCLRVTNNEEFARKVFTNATSSIQTENFTFESIHNLVLLAVQLFHVPYLGSKSNVIRLICDVFSFIRRRRDSFSIMSEVFRLELPANMDNIIEEFRTFCDCFDTWGRETNAFNIEERLERLLDNDRYREIGMSFTGKLECIILKHKNCRIDGILKFALKVLNVYIRVAMMRRMMQFSILSILSNEEMGRATERMKKYMEIDTNQRKKFLNMILEPNHENAIFLSSFRTKDLPPLTMFLNTELSAAGTPLCVQDIGACLTNKCIALRPLLFRSHWMNAAAIEFVWSTSTAPHDNYAQFCFEAVSEGDNLFFIKSYKWQTYIYMKPNSFLSQTSTKPREEGMFKVFRLQNGNCLISVMKYPGCFLYMPNNPLGRIKGAMTDDTYSNGKPNEQHEWVLKEVCHFRNGAEIHILRNPPIVRIFPK